MDQRTTVRRVRERVLNLTGEPEDTMTFTGGTMRVTGVCMCDTSLVPSVSCANNLPVVTMAEMETAVVRTGG